MGLLSRDLKLGEGDEYAIGTQDAPLYNADDPKEAAIIAWRSDCLERQGFTPSAAVAIGIRRDIDVHDVTRMRQGGATCAQVVAIVL